jgi:subtilisin-like proprotein convertase family protein
MATVEVHIVHPRRGDLLVSLVGPDGVTYPLSNRVAGTNLDLVYTVDIYSTVNGTWTLNLADQVSGQTGRLDSWTIRPALPTRVQSFSACQPINDTDASVPEVGTVESTILVAGCSSGTNTLVNFRIAHSNVADLVVTLIGPDGSTYPLVSHPGTGAFGTEDLRLFFTVTTGSTKNGVWKLQVQDTTGTGAGHIDWWAMNI